MKTIKKIFLGAFLALSTISFSSCVAFFEKDRTETFKDAKIELNKGDYTKQKISFDFDGTYTFTVEDAHGIDMYILSESKYDRISSYVTEEKLDKYAIYQKYAIDRKYTDCSVNIPSSGSYYIIFVYPRNEYNYKKAQNVIIWIRNQKFHYQYW